MQVDGTNVPSYMLRPRPCEALSCVRPFPHFRKSFRREIVASGLGYLAAVVEGLSSHEHILTSPAKVQAWKTKMLFCFGTS